MVILEEIRSVQPDQCDAMRPWLRDYHWEDIIWTIGVFWRLKPGHFETPAACRTRDLWRRESAKATTLAGALRLCRECQASTPFGKYDCESFVIIARDVVKPFLGDMSATLAAAVITIVGDYVRGTGDEAEMQRTLGIILEKFDSSGYSVSPGSL